MPEERSTDRPRRDPAARSFRLSTWLFLRLLGVVFLIAFASFWVQLDGLIGSDGLIPARETVERVRSQVDGSAFLQLPTVALWNASDAFLHGLCAAGVVLSLLLVAGVAPLPALLLLWLAYLSLVGVGGPFMSFQWDVLLLETAFTALFVVPSSVRPRLPWREALPSRTGLWLLRLLLWKLMFLSGITKLLSMDDTWWKLTALDFHYFTQPLPIWTAWYANALPAWMQRTSCLLMFVVELIAPFCVFLPRRPRLAGAAALIALQVLIAATGNYTFFNLLTIVLCVPLLDDALLLRLVPGGGRVRLERAAQAARIASSPWRALAALRLAGAAVLLAASASVFVREMARTLPPAEARRPVGRLLAYADRNVSRRLEPLVAPLAPFRTVNGYGLFRSMTTSRPEIVLEVSLDGREWEPWEFRWKPGDPTRRPRFVAPHQPRLDWQMWFAALSPQRYGFLLERLARRVLEDSPAVVDLLGPRPFDGKPPGYARYAMYDYRFTTPDERKETGAWWARTRQGDSRPVSREDFEP